MFVNDDFSFFYPFYILLISDLVYIRKVDGEDTKKRGGGLAGFEFILDKDFFIHRFDA